MGTVIKTLTDILPLSQEDQECLEQLKNVKDIDTSDMPELSDEQLARAIPGWLRKPGLYKPVKVPVKINYDADVLEWFRSFGKGYQTRMNAVLREYMLSHLEKGA